MLLERLAASPRRHGFAPLRGDHAVREHADARSLSRLWIRDPIEVRAARPSGAVAHAVRERRSRRREARPRRDGGVAAAPLATAAVAVVGASRDPRASDAASLMGSAAASPGPTYPVNPNAADVEGLACYRWRAPPPGASTSRSSWCPAAVLPTCRRLRRLGREVARGHHGWLRRGRRRGPGAAAGAGRASPRLRHADGRPELHGPDQREPEVRLNASFSPIMPPSGRIALSSQSGALGLAILELAAERGVGLSTFVSVGNKADVSGNDLLQVLGSDPATPSFCCTWNRSGIRAALPVWRGGSLAPNPSSQSKRAAQARDRAPRAATRRRWRPATSPSMRCFTSPV